MAKLKRAFHWLLSWVLIAIAILLPGCASLRNPDKPAEPVAVPVTAAVAVREKCAVRLPDEPAWAVEGQTSPDPLERSKAILAELEQRRAWGEKVKAEALKCD